MLMSGRFPLALALVLAICPTSPASAQATKVGSQGGGLTTQALTKRLAARPTGADAEKLADEVRSMFGGKAKLTRGPGPKVDGLNAAWAIEAPGASAAPKVISEDGSKSIILTRIGDTDVYAHAVTLPDGFAARWRFEVDGKAIPHPTNNPRQDTRWAQFEVYEDQPELREKPGVPRGKLLSPGKFESKVFEGTSRDWWIYVPAQFKEGEPAAVMVFQDGGGYKDFVPTVFDHLIADGSMPVTVGVFIQPGAFAGGRSNRSFEYDTLSDQYARFLLEEILPATEKEAHVTLRKDAAGRAIAGISSGGICAWTVAWERPKEFSKVLSWVGSFTNIASGKSGREGGHNYEAMIRKTPKKPIRVFLQDGANDLDNANGNWPLANQQMAKALEFSRYDYKFVYGNGFHSNRHGRAILPESLRWLWRDWKSELPK